jgi:glycosyltransferase involved in cell wall biosynthesis
MAVPSGRGHGLGETGRTVTRQRILVQVPSFNAGGSENYALRLIRHVGTGANDWHVTSGNLKNAVLEGAFRDAGATVHHASPAFGQPRQLRAFHHFLRKHRFDAVMTLTGVFGGLTLSVARLAGVPCRIGWHRRATPAYAPTAGRRIYAQASLRLLDWGATRILSNSRAALDHHHGPGWAQSAKFGVIPNGVDATCFRPRSQLRAQQRAALGIPAEARVIGHVGRLDPAKDHDTLLVVAGQLHSQYPLSGLLCLAATARKDLTQNAFAAHGPPLPPDRRAR